MRTSAAEVISPALVCTGRSSSTFTALACRPLMVRLASAIMDSTLRLCCPPAYSRGPRAPYQQPHQSGESTPSSATREGGQAGLSRGKPRLGRVVPDIPAFFRELLAALAE